MTTPLAIVIGAGGGIGAATAELLADRDYAVWCCDLRDVTALAAQLPGSGHRALQLDVTDAAAIASVVNDAWQADGFAALAYTPGLLTSGPVADLDDGDIDRVLGVNLLGAMAVARAVHRRLRQQPRPLAMAFLSSVAGLRGEAGGSLYCASKFGLVGFAQSFAAEVAEFGARVNTICPGNVDTPMLRTLAELTGSRKRIPVQQVIESFEAASAYRRLITAREVAEVCAWLVSPASSGVSGQTVVVDGPPPLS